MTTPTTYDSHATTLAIYFESAIGQPPGFVELTTPQGTAAAWASAEGTDAFRLRPIAAPNEWMVRGMIEDPTLTQRLFQKYQAIPALTQADGGSFTLTVHGSGSTTADGVQITEIADMKVWEHCWGGLKRGYTTAVATLPSSSTDFDVDSATGLEPGMFIAIEDADAPGLLWPVRVLTVSGTSITTDRDLPFSIAEGDVVHAMATAYVDDSHLTNLADANYSTISVMVQKGSNTWLAVGAHASCTGVEFPDGDVPRANFNVDSGATFVPGRNTPGAPSWSGTVQGQPGKAIGARTYLFIQEFGSTTDDCFDARVTGIDPGVPISPINVNTQCGQLEGRAGYLAGPGDTLLNATVFLNAEWATGFDDQTYYTVTYCQVGAPGEVWAFQLPKCQIQMDPVYTDDSNTQWHALTFLGHEEGITTGSTAELIRSKIIRGWG